MSKTDPTSSEAANSSLLEEDLCIDDESQIQLLKEQEEAKAQVEAASIPTTSAPMVPIVPIIYNTVSGRYRSQGTGIQLELRVDVDARRRMNRLSGDFYSVSGGTTTYFGSFVVDSISLTVTSSLITVQGLGKYTWTAGAPVLKVTIPRTNIFQKRAPATAQFLTTSGSPGAKYICPFVSVYFRTVQYEQDSVSDVTTPVFTKYNTGSLPSGCPARTLSVVGAYAEAGIEMQTAGIWNVIPAAEAGPDIKWSDSELHASMVKHFSLWADVPQWKVWLLAAQLHELGPGLLGIMFDQKGKQRQGCAVFHHGVGGTTPDKLRLQLYTYVHELGHCFNLLHSWQKGLAQPPAPNRPDALSWMNYPWNYPDGGPANFWSRFCFQFDDLEVIHLRHGFRNNVIMGGNPFIVGSAIEDPEAFSDPIEDNSGLRLELRAKKSLALGEPVVVEIKLTTTDLRGRHVVKHLHPNKGFVQIGIQKPGGKVVVYEPLIEHCVAEDVTTLTEMRPSIYESAFISYGKGGLYFDQIGTYQLRALYYAPDGSIVFSDVINLRVRSPHSDTDEEVADLLLGDEQGTLLYLLGSDSEFLKKGNAAFDKVLKEYPDHPLAVYPQLVKGFNAGRAFKTITDDRKLAVRQPQYSEAISLLSSVVDASERGQGVDNITLDTTMVRMASIQKASGDSKGAKETADRMLEIFGKKPLRPHIMQLIEEQAKKIKEKKG